MIWSGNILESHVHVASSKFPSIEKYMADMPILGISQAVLSQYIGNLDNDYLISIARSAPDRFRVIAMLDYDHPKIESQIEELASFPEIRGLRLWADTRHSKGDPLRVWKAIYENNLIASVRGPISAINDEYFHSILETFPGLKIRIEHLGSFNFSRDRRESFQDFMKLAKFQNLHLMWAGFYANSTTGYPYQDARQYLEMSLDAFGVERIMWSGDWNADILNGDLDTCSQSIQLFADRKLLPEMKDNEISWLMSKTASSFFNWHSSE